MRFRPPSFSLQCCGVEPWIPHCATLSNRRRICQAAAAAPELPSLAKGRMTSVVARPASCQVFRLASFEFFTRVEVLIGLKVPSNVRYHGHPEELRKPLTQSIFPQLFLPAAEHDAGLREDNCCPSPLIYPIQGQLTDI